MSTKSIPFSHRLIILVLIIGSMVLCFAIARPGTQYQTEDMPSELQALEGADITTQVVWAPDHAELANLVKRVTVHPLMTRGLYLPIVNFRLDLELKDGCTSQSQAGNFSVTCDGGASTISFTNDGPIMIAYMGKPFFQPVRWQPQSQIRYVKGGTK